MLRTICGHFRTVISTYLFGLSKKLFRIHASWLKQKYSSLIIAAAPYLLIADKKPINYGCNDDFVSMHLAVSTFIAQGSVWAISEANAS